MCYESVTGRGGYYQRRAGLLRLAPRRTTACLLRRSQLPVLVAVSSEDRWVGGLEGGLEGERGV